MSVVKPTLVIVGIILYSALSHAALASQDAFGIWRQLAMLMLMLSMGGIACWGTLVFLQQAGVATSWRVLAVVAMVIVLMYGARMFWPLLLARLNRIYLLEHLATNAALCWFFAHTLVGGRTPIITTLARAIHPEMPDDVQRYTRKVTVAWSLFFVVQILLSLLIFYSAQIEIWSLFANVLNWPMVIAMFAAEYACRKRVNPDFPHATIKQSVTAYFVASKRKI